MQREHNVAKEELLQFEDLVSEIVAFATIQRHEAITAKTQNALTLSRIKNPQISLTK